MRDQMKSRDGGKLRRFSNSEHGTAAVEFALVAGPFLFVLCCIVETGIMLLTEYVLQNSTQQAARTVRTGQAMGKSGGPPATAASFKTALCDTVYLVDCDSKVTVYVNSAPTFATLEGNMDEPAEIGPDPAGAAYPVVFNPGAQLQAATVIVTYDWDFVFPFMDVLGNVNDGDARRLYGMAIFRNEPFGP